MTKCKSRSHTTKKKTNITYFKNILYLIHCSKYRAAQMEYLNLTKGHTHIQRILAVGVGSASSTLFTGHT